MDADKTKMLFLFGWQPKRKSIFQFAQEHKMKTFSSTYFAKLTRIIPKQIPPHLLCCSGFAVKYHSFIPCDVNNSDPSELYAKSWHGYW